MKFHHISKLKYYNRLHCFWNGQNYGYVLLLIIWITFVLIIATVIYLNNGHHLHEMMMNRNSNMKTTKQMKETELEAERENEIK